MKSLPNINTLTNKMKIAIFASGNGSNAENIIKYFQKTEKADVVLVLTNNKKAGIIHKAKNLNVPVFEFTKQELLSEITVLKKLQSANIDLIVLAGFLLKFPKSILNHFPNKVINIHPALLPKYGGKGMYGMHIHKAVVENKENETGITIHYVNENYDEGKIIFQAKTKVYINDTPEMVADKIHILEQNHFPKVIELLFKNKPFLGRSLEGE